MSFPLRSPPLPLLSPPSAIWIRSLPPAVASGLPDFEGDGFFSDSLFCLEFCVTFENSECSVCDLRISNVDYSGFARRHSAGNLEYLAASDVSVGKKEVKGQLVWLLFDLAVRSDNALCASLERHERRRTKRSTEAVIARVLRDLQTSE